MHEVRSGWLQRQSPMVSLQDFGHIDQGEQDDCDLARKTFFACVQFIISKHWRNAMVKLSKFGPSPLKLAS